MSKPGVFYFSFTFDNLDSDETVEKTFGFTITSEGMEKLRPLVNNEVGDWYNDVVSYLEGMYGVHDRCSSPSNDVEGIGYATYEVAEDYAQELVEEWRETIIRIVGPENVSTASFEVEDASNADDSAIYHQIREQEAIL